MGGGGVGMFVSSGLNFKLRDDLHMNSASRGFESLFIEVKIQKNAVTVGTIYKPPDTSTVHFNVHVNDLFRTISQERKKCIIMADFNKTTHGAAKRPRVGYTCYDGR